MAEYDDPYLRCGLRVNPFADDHGADPTRKDWQDFIDRPLTAPPRPGQRKFLQVIGDCGAGKSTTLRHWQATQAGPWHYVPRGVGRLRRLPAGPLVYWDEVNRAPRFLRRQGLRTAARHDATVVAATHDDLTAEAQAAGFTVETVWLPAITADELIVWAARRFAAAATAAGPRWILPKPAAASIAAQCGTSWRVAGDLLHAWVAREVAALARPTIT